MDDLDHVIVPRVAPDVAAALDAAGRTEDLRFSPDGRRIALAGFGRRTVVVVDVVVEEGPAVAVDGVVVIGTDLRQPHGLDWLDAETLLVGDRGGGVARLAAPPSGRGVRTTTSASTPLAAGAHLLKGPGSLAVVRAGAGPELLVANNWADTVSRHRLGPPPSVAAESVWLCRGLDLPDGLAVSADGRWVAVSNHNEQVVLVYDREDDADPDERRAVGILRGSRYPHGLRFTPDGRHLLVADAGAPFVHVHRTAPGGWEVAAYPVGAIRVLDDATFERGHGRPDEGGPKGVDVDPSGRVMVVTTEHRALGFVDLGAALRDPTPPEPGVLASYERAVLDRVVTARADRTRAEHDALAAEVREHDARALASRTEDRARAAEADAADAHAAAEDARRRAEAAEHRAVDAERHLAAIRATRLWRAVERPRRLYAHLRARRRR